MFGLKPRPMGHLTVYIGDIDLGDLIRLQRHPVRPSDPITGLKLLTKPRIFLISDDSLKQQNSRDRWGFDRQELITVALHASLQLGRPALV